MTEASPSLESDVNVDMPAVRSELIAAQRATAESSSFHNGLMQIQNFIDAIPSEPKKLGPIAKATTDKEIHRAVMEEVKFEEKQDFEIIQSWASRGLIRHNDFWNIASIVLFLGGLLGFGGGFIALVATGNLSLFAIPVIGALATTIGCFLVEENDITLRNRIIRRKAYQREVMRLKDEGKRVRERNEKLRTMRQAYLLEARKALEPYRKDFEISNPGQTISLVESEGAFKIKAVQDESYTELSRISAMMLKGGESTRTPGIAA